jgi:hypothetical protein
MQVFSDHPVMAPEEYCSIYSAENYTQQVFHICKGSKLLRRFCPRKDSSARNLCTSETENVPEMAHRIRPR